MTPIRRIALAITAALLLGPLVAHAQAPPPVKVGFSSAMTGPEPGSDSRADMTES